MAPLGQRACEGDMTAARLILERIAPLRRGHPVHLKLPEISDAASVMNAHAALLRAVAAGKVTPEEAEPISAMLVAHLRAIETTDVDCRDGQPLQIEAIERVIVYQQHGREAGHGLVIEHEGVADDETASSD